MGSPDQMTPPYPVRRAVLRNRDTYCTITKEARPSLPSATRGWQHAVSGGPRRRQRTPHHRRQKARERAALDPLPRPTSSPLPPLEYCEPSWRLPASGYILQAGPRHVRCLAGQHVSRCMVGVFSLLRPPSWWPRPPSAEECRAWDWLRSHAGLDDGTAFLITLTVAASSEVVHRSGGEGVGTWNRPTCCEHGTDLPETWSEEVFPRSRARALCLRATWLGGY